MSKKQELVDFLDRRVFEPILNARPENDRDRAELEDIQNRTRTEQGRYHSYPSAEKVVEMYKDDLHSEHARPVNEKLRRLKLPILADVKDEFEKLAG